MSDVKSKLNLNEGFFDLSLATIDNGNIKRRHARPDDGCYILSADDQEEMNRIYDEMERGVPIENDIEAERPIYKNKPNPVNRRVDLERVDEFLAKHPEYIAGMPS